MEKHKYRKGDKIEIIDLFISDRERGIKLNDVGTILKVYDDYEFDVVFENGKKSRLVESQIQPHTYIDTPTTDREKTIRQMAHEYMISGKYECEEAIRVAAYIYDTPIPPPPSKP